MFQSHSFHSQVDSVIDICSDVMNLRSVIYVCKQKLEEIKDDYKIEVRLAKYSPGQGIDWVRVRARLCTTSPQFADFVCQRGSENKITRQKKEN